MYCIQETVKLANKSCSSGFLLLLLFFYHLMCANLNRAEYFFQPLCQGGFEGVFEIAERFELKCVL